MLLRTPVITENLCICALLGHKSSADGFVCLLPFMFGKETIESLLSDGSQR